MDRDGSPHAYRDRSRSPPPRGSPDYRRGRSPENDDYYGDYGRGRRGRGRWRGDFRGRGRGRWPTRGRDRSPSPGRGSPTYGRRYGHEYRDSRGYDRDYDGRGRYDDRREASEERRGYGPRPDGPRDGAGPLTFKEWMLRQVKDLTPTEAQQRYEEYLAPFLDTEGLGIYRAKFQSVKDLAEYRVLFHPLEIQRVLEERREAVHWGAEEFFAAMREGRVDPRAEGWEQGNGPWKATDEAGREAPPPAPASAWLEARLDADLQVAMELARSFDEERGVTGNPMLRGGREGAGANGGDDVEMDGGAAGAGAGADPEVFQGLSTAQRLDLVLTYLWRVHGADYYGAHELVPGRFEDRRRLPRAVRGPQPSGASTEGAAELEAVAGRWSERARTGDPLVQGAREQDLQQRLDAWVADQVVRHDDAVWGCTLSNKKFRGQEYVLKHIKGKHAERVEEERLRIADELYEDNFVTMHKRRDEEAAEEQRRVMEAQAAGRGRGRGGLAGRAARGAGRMGFMPVGGMVPMPMPMMGPVGMMPPGPMMGVPGPMGMPMPVGLPPPGMMAAMGRGMRGRGRGRGFKGYRDHDAPSNNRALLDYGDL